jgi:acetyl-CoA/propionyl-CoA carboxylase, biotin carboxylase, biotin carboxyl carrier protein
MNTRLQVEHPVTEAITGIDIVHAQLDVAAGEPLPFSQDDITVTGHAIEARIYAEDSFGGFLPQAGRTSLVRWPAVGGVRVDQALGSDQAVSTAYDPMLGKVIAHGPDREAARQTLLEALDRTAILGLTTNTGFLRALVASEEFRNATIDTAWLDHHEVPAPDAHVARLVTAWVAAMLATSGDPHPFQPDGFRLGAPPAPTIVELDREVSVDNAAGTVDGADVRVLSAADHVVEALVDGHAERVVVNVQPGVAEAAYRGQRFDLAPPDRLDGAAAIGDGSVIAPMPGTILDIRVAVGDAVSEGAVLGVVEAMKMELALAAPFAGTVSAVEAEVGEQVALGHRLFVVERDSR